MVPKEAGDFEARTTADPSGQPESGLHAPPALRTKFSSSMLSFAAVLLDAEVVLVGLGDEAIEQNSTLNFPQSHEVDPLKSLAGSCPNLLLHTALFSL